MRHRGTSPPPSGAEWIGGRFAMPSLIDDGGPPYRPECALWIVADEFLVAMQQVVRPGEGDAALARLLVEALAAPAAGPAG